MLRRISKSHFIIRISEPEYLVFGKQHRRLVPWKEPTVLVDRTDEDGQDYLQNFIEMWILPKGQPLALLQKIGSLNQQHLHLDICEKGRPSGYIPDLLTQKLNLTGSPCDLYALNMRHSGL